MRAVVAAVCLLAAPLGATEEPAPSPEDVKVASQEFDLGRQAFKKKEWVEAAEHFELADSRAPAAVALELAIRSRETAGQLDRAATLAALALERHPDVDKLVKLAQAVLARAARELHEVTVRCDTPCEVLVETMLVHGRPATERRVWLQPGDYGVTAGWSEGRTQKQKVSATKAGKSELDFQEPPKPEKPPEVTPPPASAPSPAAPPAAGPRDSGVTPQPSGLPPGVFWTGVGLTAVLGGVTVWSGLDTQSNPGKDAVKQACDSGDRTRCESLFDDGKAREARTNVLLGVTAGVGVLTAVIGAAFTDWSGSPKATSTRWEPVIGLGPTPLVGARGRF